MGYLNNTSSWDINGDYSGSAITGTYQGQKHYNMPHFQIDLKHKIIKTTAKTFLS